MSTIGSGSLRCWRQNLNASSRNQFRKMKKTFKTTTLSAMVTISKTVKEMDYVQVMPDNPCAGMVKPFCGRGKGQLLSDGHFEFVRKPRKHRKPVLKLTYGTVSFGADGYDRFTFVLPSSRRAEFAELLQEEASIAVDFMQGLI